MSPFPPDDPAARARSPHTLIRAGAAGFIAGGLLFAAEGTADAISSADYPLARVLGPAVLLLLLGYLGFFGAQRERTGRLGGVAMALIVPGLLVDAAGKVGLLDEPVTVIAVLAFLLGSILFGVATWRARVFPRWCAVAFILPVPLPLVIEVYGTILTGLAFVALGAVLWTRSTAPDPARTPVA
jgi:hypothetical protein